jgi:hypothetical protein
MSKNNIDKIKADLNNLQLNTDKIQEEVDKLSEQELENITSYLELREKIENYYDTTVYRHTTILKTLHNQIALIGCIGLNSQSYNTYEFKKPEDAVLPYIYFRLFELVQEPELFIKKNLALIKLLKDKSFYNGKIGIEDIDVSIISSAFVDYFICDNFEKIVHSDFPQLNEEFLRLKCNVIKWVENAIIAKGLNEKDILNTSMKFKLEDGRIHEVFWDDEMIEILKNRFQNLEDFTNTFFGETMPVDLLIKIFSNLANMKFKDFKDSLFSKLANAINPNVKLSERSKKLFIHKVFLHYNHPDAITDEASNALLNDTSAEKTTVETKKIRIVERLVKF